MIGIALLIGYAIGVVGLILALRSEAPKHAAKLTWKHYLVAFVWPIWGVWYLIVLAKDTIEEKRQARLRIAG
jgi:hypothetical protein